MAYTHTCIHTTIHIHSIPYQAKLSEANNKLIVALKENHAANERVNELTDLVAKYEADLQVATTIGEEEAKVGG